MSHHVVAMTKVHKILSYFVGNTLYYYRACCSYSTWYKTGCRISWYQYSKSKCYGKVTSCCRPSIIMSGSAILSTKSIMIIERRRAQSLPCLLSSHESRNTCFCHHCYFRGRFRFSTPSEHDSMMLVDDKKKGSIAVRLAICCAMGSTIMDRSSLLWLQRNTMSCYR